MNQPLLKCEHVDFGYENYDVVKEVSMADKVADGTFHIAEKADDVRNKVHTFSDKAKK